jgi:hypothetical protein
VARRLLLLLTWCACLLLATFVFTPAAHAMLPDAVRAELPTARLTGEGRMRWFGLLLYDAKLWVDAPAWSWDAPFALDLEYARDFAGTRIAQASADEIRRIGLADGPKLTAWRDAMARAFPDVRKGDHITGVYRPGVGAEFFHQGRSTGPVRDPEFARAFFSIWLDARTREPKLRAALLGTK